MILWFDSFYVRVRPMDDRLHIQVHTDERNHVHNARPLLLVTHPRSTCLNFSERAIELACFGRHRKPINRTAVIASKKYGNCVLYRLFVSYAHHRALRHGQCCNGITPSYQLPPTSFIPARAEPHLQFTPAIFLTAATHCMFTSFYTFH